MRAAAERAIMFFVGYWLLGIGAVTIGAVIYDNWVPFFIAAVGAFIAFTGITIARRAKTPGGPVAHS